MFFLTCFHRLSDIQPLCFSKASPFQFALVHRVSVGYIVGVRLHAVRQSNSMATQVNEH